MHCLALGALPGEQLPVSCHQPQQTVGAGDGKWRSPASISRSTKVWACSQCTAHGCRAAECFSHDGIACEMAQFDIYGMIGLGNDFIVVDNRHQSELLLTAEQAKRLCDRRCGVGGDGIIFAMSGEQVNEAEWAVRVMLCGNNCNHSSLVPLRVDRAANMACAS